eukprot:c27379_g1_i1 orf=97-303(+)
MRGRLESELMEMAGSIAVTLGRPADTKNAAAISHANPIRLSAQLLHPPGIPYGGQVSQLAIKLASGQV